MPQTKQIPNAAGSALFRAERVQTGSAGSLSLHLCRSEIVCLSGPSGSGKTRLLRALADLDDVSGSVHLNQRSSKQFSPQGWRAQVMLVPARPRWWLASAQAHFARDMEEQAQLLGLNPQRLGAPISELSTGEQARAALLRALAREPQILLLDEPTASLDHKTTQATETLLESWLNPHRAILWVTHDVQQIERMAHRHLQLDTQGLSST